MSDEIVTVEGEVIARSGENPFSPNISIEATGGAAVEAARAAAEVQAAFVVAKRFPRDEMTAYTKIVKACKRPSLAKTALYSYPRGKSDTGQANLVSGPSIRLAETLAQAWGNLRSGIQEIERNEDSSLMKAFCLDLETNTENSVTFTVPHKRDTKRGSYALTDARDIYELISNQGSRRLRACILRSIPGDLVEKAIEECRSTIARGEGEPIGDRVRKMVVAFGEVGVPQEAIEKRLGHPVGQTVAAELPDLQAIYQAIRDSFAKRHDYFELGPTPTEKAQELTEQAKAEVKRGPGRPAKDMFGKEG